MNSDNNSAMIFPTVAALLISILVVGPLRAAPTVFDPRQFGAKADGITMDTAAIQTAIDSAGKVGGIVSLAGGQYVSGTLTLESNVTLQIAKDGTLLGSTDYADYRRNRWLALIEAKDQQNIAVTGEGVIDGRGETLAANILRLVQEKKLKDAMTNHRPDEVNRPQLIELVRCSNVSVQGVTLKNAACWVETYVQCDHLELDHVTVRSTAYWNNDGIDLVDCTHTKMAHCDIDSADDGICLKSDEPDKACQDIDIEDCSVRSSASALKFGTASYGGFKQIKVHGLRIHDTYRSAIAIESVDGAAIEDVDISDVQAKNTGNAIFIRLGNRNKGGPPGSVHNVRISDVTVEIPATAPDAGYPRAGPSVGGRHNLFPSSIVGLPGHNVSDVLLKNITILTAGGGRREVAETPLEKLSTIPERPQNYPEFSMLGELPAWGFFVRHAQGISFENVSLDTSRNDYRSAFVFDDVQTLLLNNVHVGNESDNPVIVLNAVKEFRLGKTAPPEHTKEFVREIKQ